MKSHKFTWETPSQTEVNEAAIVFRDYYRRGIRERASTVTPNTVIRASYKNREDLLREIKEYLRKGKNGFINRRGKQVGWFRGSSGPHRALLRGKKTVTPTDTTKSKFRCGLRLVKSFLKRKVVRTLRSYYYLGKPQFQNIGDATSILSQICVELECTRSSCNIYPANRGSIIGNLSYLQEGRVVDCNNEKDKGIICKLGEKIPPFLNLVTDINIGNDVNFILYVEKNTTFIELSQVNFHNEYHCIIMTGFGYSDTPTLAFAKRLMDEGMLPAFCLGDCDPFGIEIIANNKFGSKNNAHENEHLAFTKSFWLGIWPSDIKRFRIPYQTFEKASSDGKKLISLLNNMYEVDDDDVINDELDIMKTKRKKAQLEDLCVYGINCLAENFLPSKLKYCFLKFMSPASGDSDDSDVFSTATPEAALFMQKASKARQELKRLHAEEILPKEQLFSEKKKKWEERKRPKYPDTNEYFNARCKWELRFKKKHLIPIYDKIASTAKDYSEFWLDALLCYKIIKDKITEKDCKALVYLEKVESERTSNFKGFKLKFTFGKNRYFENSVLTKTYEVTGDNNDSVSLEAIGDKIEWKPSHSKRGQCVKSFFHFFDSYVTSTPLSFDTETDILKGEYPEDYKIGITLRDKIIPQTIPCFTGQARVDEEKDDEEKDDEEKDADSEESSDDSDDSDKRDDDSDDFEESDDDSDDSEESDGDSDDSEDQSQGQDQGEGADMLDMPLDTKNPRKRGRDCDDNAGNSPPRHGGHGGRFGDRGGRRGGCGGRDGGRFCMPNLAAQWTGKRTIFIEE